MSFVAYPNTAHPCYADEAYSVRALMGSLRVIRVARFQRAVITEYRSPEDGRPVEHLPVTYWNLTVRKCAGAAPFVGDPLRCRGTYVWLAAIDDLGRHVAGDAELRIVPA